MARLCSTYAAAVALVVFAAACDDGTPPSAPQDGPSFARAPAFACTFNGNPSLSSAINDYFTLTADKQTANGYAAAIQTAYNTAPAPNYSAAQVPGFDLLKFVGDVARAGRGSTTAKGAAVIQQTIQCMYNVSAATGTGGAFEGWPDSSQFDFASALSFADGGAYYVRGDSTKDSPAPAVAQLATFTPPEAGNVSVLAPADTSTWARSLKQRVLIYGNQYPLTSPTGYDWKFIPRNATFNPNGVVALCGNLAGSGVVQQVGLAVLAYIDATTLCTNSSVVAMQGRSLLQRMSQFAARAFTPEPAYALALLTSTGGGLGGAKGDVFTTVGVSNVNLEWYQAPPTTMRLGNSYTAIAKASTTAGVPVNGACLYITGTNNNGTGTSLGGSSQCGTPDPMTQVSAVTKFLNPPVNNPGYATFTITPTKTGGLYLTLSANSLVVKGSSLTSNTLTVKTNVKP